MSHRRGLAYVLAIVAVAVVLPARAKGELKDFTVTIDGVEYGIDAGETIAARTRTGLAVEVKLARQPIATFRSPRVIFQHPSALTVASTSIDRDIRQHLVASATGSLIIVQEYSDLDPAPLAQLLINEVTKDDVRAGAKLVSDPTTRRLADGTELVGFRATLTRRNDTVTVEVLTYGRANQGVALVTRLDAAHTDTDQPFIEGFWKSLKLLPVAE